MHNFIYELNKSMDKKYFLLITESVVFMLLGSDGVQIPILQLNTSCCFKCLLDTITNLLNVNINAHHSSCVFSRIEIQGYTLFLFIIRHFFLILLVGIHEC